MTPQEVKLWNWLREQIVPAGFHMRRQVPIDCYIVDFACLPARLVIELDGAQHGSAEGLQADALRDKRLAALGYEVLRFSNHAVDHQKPSVLETIYAALVRRHAAEPTRPALRAGHPPLQGRDQASSPSMRTSNEVR
jgi:very-short-patch-repair endonuclease